MFFGKEKEEKLGIDEAREYLARMFDERTSGIEELGRLCATRILKARNDFMDHCSAFEALDAEPYTEDLYISNPNSIKSQKVLYARSVRHTAEKMDLEESDEKTAYERSVSLLGRADSAINEILKTNAAFRTVLYSYSNHMAEMKKDFASMERAAEELRKGIGRKDAEFAHFREIKDGITKLKDAELERRTLDERLWDSGAGPSEGRKREMELRNELIKDLEAKNAEIDEANAHISALSERISLLSAPMVKLARKHDHLSMDKLKLGDFLEDPKRTIRSREDYTAFGAMLGRMKENIEKEIIAVKNREAVLDAVDELWKSDIYELVESEKNLMAEKLGLEADARVIKESIGKVDKRISYMDDEATEVEEVKARIGELAGLSETWKKSIERMFLEFYKKRVSIAMG